MNDDDSCVMKYIEIVPLDSQSTDVKFSPCHIKVCYRCYRQQISTLAPFSALQLQYK